MIFDSSFTRILFMKGSHLCFTDLLIASSLLNIIQGTNLTWYKHVKTKTACRNLTNLTHLHISIRIFWNLFTSFVFNSLLESIWVRMFCSKHLITFEKTYLKSYRFHCVERFYIKSSLGETFTVISSMTRR